MRRVKEVFQEERGASALYFALVLFVLMGIGAIAIDGSNAYAQRRRMQTAADAAAMSGTQVLALGGDVAAIDAEVKDMAVANGVGNLTWTRSTDSKSIQFSGSSNLGIAWDYTADQKGINVSLSNDYDTFFARILGYNTLTSTALSNAGYEPIVSVDNLIPLAINGCDCVNFEEVPVQIDESDFASQILALYQIGNATYSSINYTFYLKDLDPAYPGTTANRPYYMFYVPDSAGTFTEYGDNTARALLQVVNVNGDGFIADLFFSGRTSTPPDTQSPQCTGTCSDTTDWHYYTTTTGTLTGLPNTRYAGAVLNVTRRGAALQVGTNAHLQSPQPHLGATGSLTLDVLQQPTTGITLQAHNETSTNEMTLTNEESQSECELYPIALNTTSLNGIAVGTSIVDIYNGVQPGNFGWLTWAGAPNTPTLITSLTPPGDSYTYVNPNDAADTMVSVGDWVQGSPGVANASGVRNALNTLKTMDITVPVWDQATGTGNNALYHVTDFATVRITDYKLPNQNRITATFLGYNTACTTIPTPIPPDNPNDKTPCQLAWLDWDDGIASNSEVVNYLNNTGLSGVQTVGDTVPAGPAVEKVQQVTNALDAWLNKPMTMVLYDDGNQANGYQICGFAEFTMTDYDFSSLPKWIQGEFNLSVTRGATDPTAQDYGLRGIRFQ